MTIDRLALLGGALAALMSAVPAIAAATESSAEQKLERRIDQLEKEVRELRALLKEQRAEQSRSAVAPAPAAPAGAKPAAVAEIAPPATVAAPAGASPETATAAPSAAPSATTAPAVATAPPASVATATAETSAAPASGVATVAREVTERVQVGGYGSARFETDSPKDLKSTFTLRRLVLTLDANIAPRLRSYVEIEFERFRKLELEQSFIHSEDTFGSELAIEGTNDSELSLEQAWLEFEANRGFRLVGGAILVPIGRFNLNHDDNRWDIPRRTLVDRGVPVLPATVAWDELGAGLRGDFDVGRTGALSYWLYVMNGVSLDPEVETVAETRKGDTTLKAVEVSVSPNTGTFGLDNKDGKALAGRLLFSPALGHEIAGSFYWGRYTPDFLPDEDAWTLAADGGTEVGPIQVQGEFAFTRFNGIENVATGFAKKAVNSESAVENETTEVEVEFELANLATQKYGYWLYLRYPFFPEFLRDTVLGRPFENPQFSIFAQPEQVWFNGLVKEIAFENAELTEFSDESRILNRFTTGIAYRPTPLVVFSLAYEYAYTNSGKSLASVTNYLGTTSSHANSFLAGIAFGF
ncbi:MAG TPA: hypothetical protein VFD92_28440 [Candidatus Binatia bacterium]|nr:hypothetical protein [Candidatus Binatia bacterium]